MALFRKLICLLILQVVSGQESSAGKKVSDFLQQKFATYDQSVRPNHGGDPVAVTVSGYVLDISEISEKTQDFTVSLYLRHQWKDSRLEFTEADVGMEKIQLTKEYADKLWKVDTFVVNERESRGHDLLTENVFTRLSSDGTVLTSSRFTIRASCKMELGWFPFDRHTCSLLLESYGQTANDFEYQWKSDSSGNTKTAVGVSSDVTSITFNVAAVNTRLETVTLTIAKYSRISVDFFFIRSATRYVHEVYFPAIILTLLAFVTLLHETGTSKSRLQISILLEGLLILLTALSATNMPKVNYQTALDFYLMICLLIILLVVSVNVAFCLVINSNKASNGIVRLRSVYDNNHVEEADEGKEVLFDTASNISPQASRIFTHQVELVEGNQQQDSATMERRDDFDSASEGLTMRCPDSACHKEVPISEMLEHAVKLHNVPLLENSFGNVEVKFKVDLKSEIYKRKVWICAALRGHTHEFLVAIESGCRSISLVKIFPYVVTHPVSKKFWIGIKTQGQGNESDYATWHKCILATQSTATAFINGDFILLHENHLRAYGQNIEDNGIKCTLKLQILVHDCTCQADAKTTNTNPAHVVNTVTKGEGGAQLLSMGEAASDESDNSAKENVKETTESLDNHLADVDDKSRPGNVDGNSVSGCQVEYAPQIVDAIEVSGTIRNDERVPQIFRNGESIIEERKPKNDVNLPLIGEAIG
ncbi:unnamed protein product [Orchesella dallaii]|uniref:Neurotransmitter-gated ion-channel ligand-binding domain-containing protein n=1 Tax=Orchesella dallaii TaxID=48710 RepID=A0ABP1S3B6_9HEXA